MKRGSCAIQQNAKPISSTKRTWGEGLLNDGRDELQAAGSATLMLIQ
jgi:hypothetical protein